MRVHDRKFSPMGNCNTRVIIISDGGQEVAIDMKLDKYNQQQLEEYTRALGDAPAKKPEAPVVEPTLPPEQPKKEPGKRRPTKKAV